jgi:hypothetical protein
MSLDKATLKAKWWFNPSVLFFAVLTKIWVLSSAGVRIADRESFLSALTAVDYFVMLGLWYLYAELAAFLIPRIWATLARRSS